MAGFLSGANQIADNPRMSALRAAAGSGDVSGTAGIGGPGGSGPVGPANAADVMQQLAAMRQAQSPNGLAVQVSPATLAGAGLQNNYHPTNMYDPNGGGGAAAAAAPGVPVGGNLGSWIAQAEKITGVDPTQWGEDLAMIAQHESGGNPNAINNWDSNAAAGHPSQGLMQTIPGTFNQYVPASLRSLGIDNPVANVAAAIEYILSRYGNIDSVPGVAAVDQGRSYVGY